MNLKNFLKQNLDDNDIKDILRGFINSKTLLNIYDSILDYINKYSIKYLISLSNIDKLLLPCYIKENYSKFYIGVSDEGIISGIPVEFTKLNNIKVDLECKLNKYYNEFIGLHKKKEMKK